MKFFSAKTLAISAVLGSLVAVPLAANPQLAYIEGARANMDVLDTRSVQSTRFDYPHAVTIALPASYAVQPDKQYPVIWVLDDPLMTRSVIAMVDLLVSGNKMPEAIVVGVGSPSEEGLAGVGRRVMEFSPEGDGFFPDGPAAEVASFGEYPQRADDFQAFLLDELRPQLAQEFRMADFHVLQGHSLGGMFAGYTLFTRPEAFDAMIIGSAAMANVDRAAFRAEERFWAAGNRQLDVDLFVAAGGDEANDWFLANSHILSSTVEFSERLQARNYAGLSVETQFYEGEDHYTVVPRLLKDGLMHIFVDEAADLEPTWPKNPAAN